MIGTLVVHEPPLGQLLTDDQRRALDLDLDAQPDAGAALDAIAASVGVTRGAGRGPGAGGGPRPADVETFIRRDAPAIGAYRLDLGRLRARPGATIVSGSAAGRAFYPYQCAQRLAEYLGTLLVELPGDHADMIKDPAPFAASLLVLLDGPSRA
jgi:hypothetical protein